MHTNLPPHSYFLVGGAVRDQLLDLPVKDRDWVVIGQTPDAMRAAGFRQVGRNFPVFLHPETQEEYALARTERKQGIGHTGFTCHATPDVTLEQDLFRRDLTINAMAQDANGHIIDPYHGQQDLENRVLRAVSPAFKEDPLRVLRVARFAAQLADYNFQIEPQTLHMMRDVVATGELASLAPERIWQEWQTALQSPAPQRFFETLKACSALPLILPMAAALDDASCQRACTISSDVGIRFCALTHRIDQVTPYLALPKWLSTQQQLVHQYSVTLSHCKTAMDYLDLLYALDAYRRPERLSPFATTCTAILDTTQSAEQLIYAWEQTHALTARQLPATIQGAQTREALYTLRRQKLEECFSP